jgi:hypothetical protein
MQPRFVPSQIAGLRMCVVDIGEGLPVVIADDEARALVFDRPRWRDVALLGVGSALINNPCRKMVLAGIKLMRQTCRVRL